MALRLCLIIYFYCVLLARTQQEPEETIRAPHPVLLPGGWRERPPVSPVPRQRHGQRQRALVKKKTATTTTQNGRLTTPRNPNPTHHRQRRPRPQRESASLAWRSLILSSTGRASGLYWLLMTSVVYSSYFKLN